MSAARWIALHCGEETAALLENYPNAFLLLAQIAMRAQWKDCPITKLRAGEAFVGDWRKAGLQSEMIYRGAKQKLQECGLATFQGTNKGTLARLVNTEIFSLSPSFDNGQNNGQATTQQRTGNDPATDRQRPSNGQTTSTHTEYTDTQNTLTPFVLGDTPPTPTAKTKTKKPQADQSKERGTLEELRAFAVEIGAEASDGEACFYKWEGNGWTNNGKPINSWRDTIRTWQLHGYLASQKRAENHTSTPQIAATTPPGTSTATADEFSPAAIVGIYPRRERIAEAAAEVSRQIEAGEDPAAIMTGTRAAAAEIMSQPGGHLNAYVPSAFSFFRDRRWADDPAAMFRNQAARANGAPQAKLDLGGRRPASETIID